VVGALLSIASFKRIRLFSILLIALDMVEAGEALAEYDEEEEPLTKLTISIVRKCFYVF
jgi:hypothetical protein